MPTPNDATLRALVGAILGPTAHAQYGPNHAATTAHWKRLRHHLTTTPAADLVAWAAANAPADGCKNVGIPAAHARAALAAAGHPAGATEVAVTKLFDRYLPSVVPGRGPLLRATQAHALALAAAPYVGTGRYTARDAERLAAPWRAIEPTLAPEPEGQ